MSVFRFVASRLLPAAALVLSTTLGCGPSRPAAQPGTLEYTQQAASLYRSGLRAFYERDWEEATSKFNELRDQYGQSPYAALAELRLADISLEKGEAAEAVSAYKEFVRGHRGDPAVVYARYRICKALHAQINDTVLLPPQEERDQGPVHQAYAALLKFRRDYPHTKWDREIDFLYRDVAGRLARHEMYVARFYLKKDRFEASVERLKTVMRNYPDSGLAPEALLMLGETYLKMKEVDKARVAFRRAVTNYPASPFTKLCKTYLKKIGDHEIPDVEQ